MSKNRTFLFGLVMAFVLLFTACGTPQAQPSATPAPTIQPTATVVPTATSVIPTPIPERRQCTPDDTSNRWGQEIDKLTKLENTEPVTLMKIGDTYSIFLLSGGEQICIHIMGYNVHLVINEINNLGLRNTYTVGLGSDLFSLYPGKPTIIGMGNPEDWDQWKDEYEITITTPMVTGENDRALVDAWPSQLEKIDQGSLSTYTEPISVLSPDYAEDSPASLCNWMGRWEVFAPLPKELEFCKWQMPDESFRGHVETIWLYSDITIYIFLTPPDSWTENTNPPILHNQNGGVLQPGQKFGGRTVLASCQNLPKDWTPTASVLRDPVVVMFDDTTGFDLPRDSWIGVEPYNSTGVEYIYKVCPQGGN